MIKFPSLSIPTVRGGNVVFKAWNPTFKSASNDEHWITIHPHGHGEGGVHIQIDSSGKIVAGPSQLATRGIRHISDFGEHRGRGPTNDAIEELKPHAHQFLGEQHYARENAKENARKVTGLHAGQIARIENSYRDHSSVHNFDTASRTVARENPELGFDPEAHDTPAKVWDLIREGKKTKPSIHSEAVHNLASEWASQSRRPTHQTAPVYDSDDDFNMRSLNARRGR